MAGRPGFEPGLSSPEPEVLPLNYLPLRHSLRQKISRVNPYSSSNLWDIISQRWILPKKARKTIELMLTRAVGRKRPGELVQVKGGYARNYLIPKGYGIRVKGNEDKIQSQLEQWKTLDEVRQKEANEHLEQLQGMKLSIKAESGIGGSLYGSVGAVQIIAALEEHGVKVSKQDISTVPIKALGDYKVKVRLYGGNSVELELSVVPIHS